MDKQNEIEKLARIIEPCSRNDCTSCKRSGSWRCNAFYKATDIINAGYGNLRDFVKKLIDKYSFEEDETGYRVVVDIEDIEKLLNEYENNIDIIKKGVRR